MGFKSIRREFFLEKISKEGKKEGYLKIKGLYQIW